MKFTYRMFEKEIEYEDGKIVKLSEGMNRTMMFFYIYSGKIYDLQIVADYVYTNKNCVRNYICKLNKLTGGVITNRKTLGYYSEREY